MCTAITYATKDHYFGRNLDLEFSYQEEVVITPRKFPLAFRTKETMKTHHSMIGIATVANEYPLYYDATNEYGLSMAGLNFPGNAVYNPTDDAKDNIAPFELIPWILGQCKTVSEAEALLKNVNILKQDFSKAFPLSPLHWIIADAQRAITVEPMIFELKIHDNSIGILTNNPPFEFHMQHLSSFLNLTREEPENRFAPNYPISPYSRGMGAYGLPGDLSSASRFVRAAFTKLNSVSGENEDESVCQFFHILTSVAQQNGCVRVGDTFEKTVYTSCCNMDKGIYYYTTYENRQICAVNMCHVQLDDSKLYRYPLIRNQQIFTQN